MPSMCVNDFRFRVGGLLATPIFPKKCSTGNSFPLNTFLLGFYGKGLDHVNLLNHL